MRRLSSSQRVTIPERYPIPHIQDFTAVPFFQN